MTFVDRAVEVGLDGGFARQQPERPREGDGGRLMAGQEEREDLVAHLLVAHPAAVLLRSEQMREAAVTVRAAATALRDHVEDDPIERLAGATEPPGRRERQPFGKAQERREDAVELRER